MITYRSIPLPPKRSKDDEIRASEYNMLIDAVRLIAERQAMLQVVTSNDIGVKSDGATGTLLYLKKHFKGASRIADRIPPLTIVGTRPVYIPESLTPIPPNHKRFWITWGTVNDRVLTNWNNVLDVPLNVNGTKYIYLKATLTPTGAPMVQSALWETWTSETEKTNPDWSANGNRPGHYYLMLGLITVFDGVATVTNAGGGSIIIMEHVSSINQNGPELKFGKSLLYQRLTY